MNASQSPNTPKNCSGNSYSPAQIVWGAQFQPHVLSGQKCASAGGWKQL